MAKKELRKAIKAELMEQLERNGTVGKYYTDLVDDYMELWDAKNLLAADIRKRGAVVDYISNNGTKNKRKNDSIGELVKVNDRMVKLLDALGIAPVPAGSGLDDEM